MKDQRGSAHLPIILALLFGAAVVVTIFGYMLWPKDSDTDTSSVVDVNKVGVNSSSDIAAVDGLKTYTSSEYYFSFQYPEGYKDLAIQKNTEREAWSLNSGNVLKESGTTKALATLLSQPQEVANYPTLEVNVFPLDKYNYIDRPGGVVYVYYAGDIWNGEGDEAISNPKLTRIKGKNTTGFLTGSGDMGVSRTSVLFINQQANQVVELNFTSMSALDGTDDLTTKNQDIWKSVVSTFSFSDLTANWKTYTNSSLRYSIKYPSNWSILETDKQTTFSGAGNGTPFTAPSVTITTSEPDPKSPCLLKETMVRVLGEDRLRQTQGCGYAGSAIVTFLKTGSTYLSVSWSDDVPTAYAIYEQVLLTLTLTD